MNLRPSHPARMHRTTIGVALKVLGALVFFLGGLFSASFLHLKGPALAKAIESRWNDYWDPKTVRIPSYNAAREQWARFAAAPQVAPLIVDLHPWSEDHKGTSGSDVPLDEMVAHEGWNYIRPALAGPNKTPDACCSQGVIDGISAAVSYAQKHGRVDDRAIYLVGSSGGGYTALCFAHNGGLNVRSYFVWVPVTDLTTWYAIHSKNSYGDDIRKCTSSGSELNMEEAKKRSPMYMGNIERISNIHIFHGIRDGIEGSVSPDHSIRYFNRIAKETGNLESEIDSRLRIRILEERNGPDLVGGKTIGGRSIHLERVAGNSSLILFDGAHELLVAPTIEMIKKDYEGIIHNKK